MIILYHGTVNRYVKDILHHGIKPKHEQSLYPTELYVGDRGKSVFLTSSLKEAWFWAVTSSSMLIDKNMFEGTEPAVFKVIVDENKIIKDECSDSIECETEESFMTEPIPAENIIEVTFEIDEYYKHHIFQLLSRIENEKLENKNLKWLKKIFLELRG